MMESKLLILGLFALVSVVATDDYWVRKVQYRSDYMLTTRAGNYAIKSPDFLQKDWLTIHVNGDHFFAISSSCKEYHYNMDDGQRAAYLIDAVKERLDKQASREVCSIYLNQGKQKSLEIISYREDGSADNILSLNMRHATDEVALVGQTSVFYQEGVLTTIDRDGKIEMKPSICLTQEEIEYLERLRSAEDAYRSLMEKSERLIATIMDEFTTRLFSRRIVELSARKNK